MSKKRNSAGGKIGQKPTADEKAKTLANQAVKLAEWAAQALVTAELLRIKDEPVGRLSLNDSDQAVLATLSTVVPELRKKLAKTETEFTIAELAGLTMALAESFADAEPKQQVELLMIAKRLMDCLQDEIAGWSKPARITKPRSGQVFQFKITLLGIKPSIWRRVHVKDCTLDKLHEHIQTAMGWTNSHLHQFEIDDEIFGDPELLDDGFADFACEDSTITKISEVVPESSKRFRLLYQYDFGDSWEHEVLFEGCLPVEKGMKYPLCLEGERACPPEDVGGVWGYEEFLEALTDPKHERHDELLEWRGPFDPEKFDPKEATKHMKRGLPDWRVGEVI
jgi:hypothetical protein